MNNSRLLRGLAPSAILLFLAAGLCQVVGCSGSQQSEPAEGAGQGRSARASSPPEDRAEQTAVPTTPPAVKDKKDKYEPLFVDWPQPQLTLLITGRQHGYIEPCGCTGLENMKGGLSRRHTLLGRLVERGWRPVAIDVGNQVRRIGRQAEIKYQTTIDGLKKIGYQGIGYGPDDLRLAGTELYLATLGDGKPAPLVCANASVLGQTPSLRTFRVGEKKIGITSILGAAQQKVIASKDIELSSPDEALARVVPKLQAEQCDLLILLAHASLEESKRLAKKFPHFDIVVTAGGATGPPRQPEKIAGTGTTLLQVGEKGMYAGVVGVYDDPDQKLRYQRVPLDGRFADSKPMIALLASYQAQLEALGLEGLTIRPLPHPSGHGFAGTESCAECHTEAYKVWKNTPHAHATDSLVHPRERDMPRHFDPECLSCHVTGWNPREYFPYKTGYLGLESTPKLHNVGCENCHGPGAEHVAAENGDVDLSEEQIETLRQQLRLPLESAERNCLLCHDLDNSPDFHVKGAFRRYWRKVKHKGMD